jgi:tetratricopeptide (TPR) repeat protein
MGLGQVLRVQGDSHGAWENETRAKEVFQEVGDKTPEARAELHLAQLLLDRGENSEALKAIERAQDLLSKTTSPRDDATAKILLSQTLLASGKIREARESISPALQFAERSRDLDILLMSRVMAARIDAAVGNPAQRRQAAKQLNAVAQQAKAAQFAYPGWEARLTAGELELKSGNAKAGRTLLQVLQEEASSQGFLLVVQKAGMVLGRSENQAALRMQD